jgi:hypothetical protein
MRKTFDRRVVPEFVLDFVRFCQQRIPCHLGGGAALAGVYLGHRTTGVVDLFVHEVEDIRSLVGLLPSAAADACRVVNLPQRELSLPWSVVNLPQAELNLPWRIVNLPQRKFNLPWGVVNLLQGKFNLPRNIVNPDQGKFNLPWGIVKPDQGRLNPGQGRFVLLEGRLNPERGIGYLDQVRFDPSQSLSYGEPRRPNGSGGTRASVHPHNTRGTRRGRQLEPGMVSQTTGMMSPTHRPNGPAEHSPGLRPQADALGRKAINHRGLKGPREFYRGGSSLGSGSLGLSGRRAVGPVDPGHRPAASALGLDLPARWAGPAGHDSDLSERSPLAVQAPPIRPPRRDVCLRIPARGTLHPGEELRHAGPASLLVIFGLSWTLPRVVSRN